MEKRALLAIFLSILVIFFFQYMFGRKPYHFIENKQKRAIPNTQVVEEKSEPQPIVNKEIMFNDTVNDTVYDTDKYRLTFTNRGGGLRKIELKEYREKADIFPTLIYETEPAKFLIFDILINGDLNPKNFNRFVWKYTPSQDGLIYSLNIPDKYTINKRYKIEKDEYLIQLDVNIQNTSGRDLKLEYSIIAASGINISAPLEQRYSYGLVLIGDEVQRRLLTKINRTKIEYTGDIKWAGIKNKYFSILLSPSDVSKGVVMQSIFNNPVVSIKMSSVTIPVGSSVSKRFYLYAGADDIEIMKSYGMEFERAVNFGLFDRISRVLLSILKFFYKITNSYGIAIIFLTISVSLVLFPLTFKSFSATKQMQKIQPHITKLREEYKDEPQKLNKELIELYKQHKVNPLGGCFPLLLQMPIFIALYQALTRSIELKGEKFLWIKDLSMPDAAFKLPFSLPVLGNNVNILPILMIIVMFFQQRVSQVKTGLVNPQQKQFSLLMPLIFGIIFYNLPSGLVLYWFTNTLIMSVIQWKLLRSKE